MSAEKLEIKRQRRKLCENVQDKIDELTQNHDMYLLTFRSSGKRAGKIICAYQPLSNDNVWYKLTVTLEIEYRFIKDAETLPKLPNRLKESNESRDLAIAQILKRHLDIFGEGYEKLGYEPDILSLLRPDLWQNVIEKSGYNLINVF